jgi:hypothetical protein
VFSQQQSLVDNPGCFAILRVQGLPFSRKP